MQIDNQCGVHGEIREDLIEKIYFKEIAHYRCYCGPSPREILDQWKADKINCSSCRQLAGSRFN